jgi:hypothetical protein
VIDGTLRKFKEINLAFPQSLSHCRNPATNEELGGLDLPIRRFSVAAEKALH